MSQSRKASALEALANVALGYVLAVLTQVLVFPLFNLDVTFGDNLSIGLVFVGVSLLRSYVLRRLFERFRSNG
jgi:hypothetical protein